MVVAGLSNGTAYGCSVTATNAVGTGAASASVSVTPVAVSSSVPGATAGVACSYSYSAFNASASVNATSTAAWSCDSTSRVLSANGIPDHDVGTFPNPDNPNTISAQTVAATFSLSPAYSGTATQLGGPAGVVSFMLNGVKTDPGTGGSCDNTGTVCSLGDPSGTWSIEALTQSYFKFGTDSNNAHVQPGGTYHYHGMPEGLITKLGGGSATMTLIGWAADGFPVYARYGHTVASRRQFAVEGHDRQLPVGEHGQRHPAGHQHLCAGHLPAGLALRGRLRRPGRMQRPHRRDAGVPERHLPLLRDRHLPVPAALREGRGHGRRHAARAAAGA